MIGKQFNKIKIGFSNTVSAMQPDLGNLDITESHKFKNPESLPKAPNTAFRKRPVRLTYDKNEYYTFRMPSENDFLLSSFDSQDLFGKRKGINQSPHIKA